jgi:hypothetical protein
MLFSLAGMMLFGSTRDLLVAFIALEIMSLGVYVMTGLVRGDGRGAEAAFKYFVLGAFSSAFFLYGIALAYAAAGTTRLDELALVVARVERSPDLLLVLAMAMLLVGFAFKVSAVPFHMWTPDAYQGAPTLVTGFMSTGVKAAAFAAFARVFLTTLGPLRAEWLPVLSANRALLHGFQQRGLCFRRRAVDLVGQDQVVKDGPRLEPQRAIALLFMKNIGARDVRRQKIRRELYAAERKIERLRERRDEQRLRQTRHTHEQRVTSCDQRHEHRFDHRLLPHHHLGDGRAKRNC